MRNPNTGKEFYIIFWTPNGVMRREETYPKRILAEKAKKKGDIVIERSKVFSKVKSLTTNKYLKEKNAYLDRLENREKNDPNFRIDEKLKETVVRSISLKYEHLPERVTKWWGKPCLFNE